MNKEKYIIESINQLSGINVYENKRTQEIVDVRSLTCYILHKDLKLTLYKIRDHFNEKGKKFTHATIIHNVKLYEEVRIRKPHLDSIRDTILTTIDPKYLLLKRIQNIDDMNKIKQIINCLNYNEL